MPDRAHSINPAEEPLVAASFHDFVPVSGNSYAEKYRYYHEHWQGHINASRRAILDGAAAALGGSATVLGAGDCKEIPLLELLDHFETITLVDVDEDSLWRAIENLEPEQQQRVQLLVRDLTNGAALSLTEAAAAVIEGAVSAGRACGALVELYRSVEVREFDAWDWQALRASYVVSSVVASQLLPYLELWINRQFENKFGRKPEELPGDHYREAREALNRRFVANHASLLAWLAAGGIVYWSCDVRQELVMGHLSQEHTQVLGQQMTEYLREIDWQALRSRLEVDPGAGGQFTAYLTAQIGRGVLPPEMEIDIIEFMVKAAQRLDRRVARDMLGGEMARYFSSYLEPIGEQQTWWWHLYPGRYYRGGVHRVEAWLLRSLSR